MQVQANDRDIFSVAHKDKVSTHIGLFVDTFEKAIAEKGYVFGKFSDHKSRYYDYYNYFNLVVSSVSKSGDLALLESALQELTRVQIKELEWVLQDLTKVQLREIDYALDKVVQRDTLESALDRVVGKRTVESKTQGLLFPKTKQDLESYKKMSESQRGQWLARKVLELQPLQHYQTEIDILRDTMGYQFKRQALSIAINYGLIENMELIFKYGVDPTGLSWSEKSQKGKSRAHISNAPLVQAFLSSGDSIAIADLLMRHGVDVNLQDSWHRTALLYLSERDITLEALKFLVEKGADVNAQDAWGRMALHHLSRQNRVSLEALKFLIEKGADVNARDVWGRTALANVVKYGSYYNAGTIKAMRFLLEKGAKVNIVLPRMKKEPTETLLGIALERLESKQRKNIAEGHDKPLPTDAEKRVVHLLRDYGGKTSQRLKLEKRAGEEERRGCFNF